MAASALPSGPEAAAPLTRIGRALGRWPAAWLALLAFLLYLPLAARVLQINPDALEYVDIAQRLASGGGYELAIRAYHLGGTEVLHDGLDERPPLYTLLAAAILRLGGGTNGLQVANAALAAGCAALVYAIGQALFGRQVGLLAGLLAAFSPPVLVNMLPPMSEALVMILSLLAVWLVVRGFEAPRAADFALAGAALGLGYLTRPVTAAVAAALVLGIVVASRDRRALLRPLAALMIGAALFVGPITLWSLVTRGSLSYTGQSYLYAVYHSFDVRVDANLRPLPKPSEFILANPGFVAGAIIDNLQRYVTLMLFDPKWLLFFLPAWAAVIYGLVRGRYPRAVWPLLAAAVANLTLYTITWAAYQRRYQLLVLLLVLPLLVDGLGRLGLTRLRLGGRAALSALTLAVLAIAVYWGQSLVEEYRGTFRYGDDEVPVRLYHGVRWSGAIDWANDRDIHQAFDWVKQNTEPDDILAGRYPHPFTYFTARPSTLLPGKLDLPTLRKFLVDYRVSFVLLNNFDGYRRRYQEALQSLAGEGVDMTPLGDYRIFNTRALWREAGG